jgi:adenylate kinase family enzyme
MLDADLAYLKPRGAVFGKGTQRTPGRSPPITRCISEIGGQLPAIPGSRYTIRMEGLLVVLTGASGAGKTTLAAGIQERSLSRWNVLSFDSIGVPSVTEIAAFGTENQPGGTWQRNATLQWMDRIAGLLRAGESVLFEGQMRIAFIQEAIAASKIANARVLLLDCADQCRVLRLAGRGQPQQATRDKMNWSRYMREEALQTGCEILDTGLLSLGECLERLTSYLQAPLRAAPEAIGVEGDLC